MKLHIGCGSKYLPGYTHVDVIKYDHVDIVTDANKLTTIEDSQVEEIYACHILEHFKRNQISEVLKEWNRVLKVKGIVRLAVPDFDSIVMQYQESKNLDGLMGLLYGGQTYDYNFHHVTFTFNSLSKLLEECNFTNIQRYNWQEFLPEGFDDYSRAYIPHMDFQNGRLMSLNIVAEKLN